MTAVFSGLKKRCESFDMSVGKKITSNLECGNAPDTLGARELCAVSGFGQVFGFVGRGFGLAAARATPKKEPLVPRIHYGLGLQNFFLSMPFLYFLCDLNLLSMI